MITDDHREQVTSSLKKQRPLVVTSHSYLPHAQTYVDKLLRVFLTELGIPALFDQLSFCIRELGVNAKKANTKRLYFERHGLDPRNPTDYAKGMLDFKRETLGDQGYYLAALKARDLYVKIEFLRWKGSCSVAVRNNVPALPEEVARVQDKVAKTQQYAGLEDAFGENLDETEGAGLGIVVLILMLRKLGFDGDFFQFYTLGNETIARIILPLTLD